MTAIPPILKLDVGGLPVGWVSWQAAVTLYARERVRWEAGEARFLVRGGTRRDGLPSELTISSIIAVQDRKSAKHRSREQPLTNRALFERDGYLCMYCGGRFRAQELSRDHVTPISRGGRDVWTNVLSACRACNCRKDDRMPEEAGMKPLAVPYQPDHARYLLLIASGRVTGCQQAFLEALAKTERRPN